MRTAFITEVTEDPEDTEDIFVLGSALVPFPGRSSFSVSSVVDVPSHPLDILSGRDTLLGKVARA